MPTNKPGYSKEYYRMRRNVLIDIMGGSCQECGVTKTLEFHHTDLSGEHGIGSWRQIYDVETRLGREEPGLALLCHECHILEHKKRL
jgi:5-methylcytosine-specific restriction endonuclease McrA